MRRALVSLQEELEAVDWYRQRAEACRDGELRAVLPHNMREEIEHSAMVLDLRWAGACNGSQCKKPNRWCQVTPPPTPARNPDARRA